MYGIVVDLQILIPWSLLLSAALNKTPLPTTPGVGYDMAALLAAQYALVSEVGTSLGGAVASDVSLMTLLAPLLEKVAVDAGVPLLSLGLTGIVMLPAPTPTPTPLNDRPSVAVVDAPRRWRHKRDHYVPLPRNGRVVWFRDPQRHGDGGIGYMAHDRRGAACPLRL